MCSGRRRGRGAGADGAPCASDRAARASPAARRAPRCSVRTPLGTCAGAAGSDATALGAAGPGKGGAAEEGEEREEAGAAGHLPAGRGRDRDGDRGRDVDSGEAARPSPVACPRRAPRPGRRPAAHQGEVYPLPPVSQRVRGYIIFPGQVKVEAGPPGSRRDAAGEGEAGGQGIPCVAVTQKFSPAPEANWEPGAQPSPVPARMLRAPPHTHTHPFRSHGSQQPCSHRGAGAGRGGALSGLGEVCELVALLPTSLRFQLHPFTSLSFPFYPSF